MTTSNNFFRSVYSAVYEVSRVKKGTPYGFKVSTYLSNANGLTIKNVYVYDCATGQTKTEIPLSQCSFNKFDGIFTIRMTGQPNFGLFYSLNTTCIGQTQNIIVRPKIVSQYLSTI
jgi:hypothetical protein